MRNRIIIEVKGGVVTRVYSRGQEITIYICDLDAQEEPNPIVEIEPEPIGKEVFDSVLERGIV